MARDRYRKVRAAIRKAERQAEQIHQKEGGRLRTIRRKLVPAAKVEALHKMNGPGPTCPGYTTYWDCARPLNHAGPCQPATD